MHESKGGVALIPDGKGKPPAGLSSECSRSVSGVCLGTGMQEEVQKQAGFSGCVSGCRERAVPGFLHGKLGQPGLVFLQETPHGNHATNRRNSNDDPGRAGDFGDLAAQRISAQRIAACPAGAAQRIEQHEARPVHAAGPGQHGHKHPHDGNKPATEDNGAAVVVEQILPQNQTVGIEPEAWTVFLQQGQPDPAANDVADVIANNRPGHSGHGHPANGEVMRLEAIERGRDNAGLSRDWHPHALHHDNQGNNAVAVMLKQRVQMVQQGSGVLVQEGATEPRRVGGPCRKPLPGRRQDAAWQFFGRPAEGRGMKEFSNPDLHQGIHHPDCRRDNGRRSLSFLQ